MSDYTEAPATADQWSQMTDAEQAEWIACQDDHDDLMSQMEMRERLYETDQITWEEYHTWEFDYSPLPSLDTH